MSVPAPRASGVPAGGEAGAAGAMRAASSAFSASSAFLVRRFPDRAELRLNPPWAVIRPYGEIDLATAPGFRQAVGEALRAAQPSGAPSVRHYVVDLREVTFLDSSGLSVLALLVRDAPARGCTVSLVGVQPHVRTVLKISGLLAVLPEHAPAELPAPAQLVLG